MKVGGSLPRSALQGGVLDAPAIGLSGLCLLHCFALPLLVSFMPVAGVWSEYEWVHQGIVLLAAPITLAAMVADIRSRRRPHFIVLSAFGLSLLISAAFVQEFARHETSITSVGAVFLASAHVIRWSGRLKRL